MPGKDADADGRAGGDAGSSALLPHPVRRAASTAQASAPVPRAASTAQISAPVGMDNPRARVPEREGASLSMLESARPRDIQFVDDVERPRVNTLREKFNVDHDEARPHWFDESWSAIKRTFNL